MQMISRILNRSRRFARNDSGAALVEFAIMLPMLLLLFAVTIEGGRLMWSYQTVAAGVRDASRYLARVAPIDICTSGAPVSAYTSDLETIVKDRLGGGSLFPSGITVTSVTPSLTCIAGTFRVSPAPVVQVTAGLTVTFPFASIFSFNGQSRATINTTIADQSRVYGS